MVEGNKKNYHFQCQQNQNNYSLFFYINSMIKEITDRIFPKVKLNKIFIAINLSGIEEKNYH